MSHETVCSLQYPLENAYVIVGMIFKMPDMVSEIAIKRRNESHVAMALLRATESPEDSLKHKSQSHVAIASLRAT